MAFTKGNAIALPLIYLFVIFSPEALHMEGVVIETSKGPHLIGNREF
jgi:hypothetical protein